MESASLVRTLPDVTEFKSTMKSNDDMFFDDDDYNPDIELNGNIDEDSILNDDNETETYNSKTCVTEDEIRASLNKKEETDSLSLSSDYETVDAVSQLSALSKSSIDDLSLDALIMRRNELINSMRSNLDTSSISNVDDPFNDSNISTSTVIGKDVCKDEYKETVPPAAKFLKDWKPSFSNDTSQSTAKKQSTSKSENYEKACSSLTVILSQPTDNLLDSYSSQLDVYEVEDQRKIDGYLSQIDTEKKTIFSPEKSTAEEINEIIELSDTTLVDDTVIEIEDDTDEQTLVEDIKTETEAQPISEPAVEVKKEDENVEMVGMAAPIALVLPDDKDPENLIIGSDDVGVGAENLDDVEDLLLASDDEDVEAIPKASAAPELKVFISNDEDENRDNEDPKWDFLRNLSNDYERYLAVRQQWKNLEIPNPKKDLTCRCYRVRIGEVPVSKQNVQYRNGKRPHSPEIHRRDAKRARRESCTMLFDRSIAQLVKDVEIERFHIEREQDQRLKYLADIQTMEQISAHRERQNDRFIRDMKRRHYMDTENLIKDYGDRLNDLRERSRQKIDALKQAAAEVREFHEFYPDQESSSGEPNSLVYLTEPEVQEILEVEDMLMRFETFYKVPPSR